jgi:glycosyl transferase family 25
LEAFDGKLLRWNEELDKIFRNITVLWHAPKIGCAMSHLSVWKRIASSNCKLCLVLEDDALFSDRWIDMWNQEYYPELPQNKFVRTCLPTFSLIFTQIVSFPFVHIYSILSRDFDYYFLEYLKMNCLCII